jgi:hypothetical protein
MECEDPSPQSTAMAAVAARRLELPDFQINGRGITEQV